MYTTCLVPFTPPNRLNWTQNYTQNIDTLESIAGITRILQCHGSFKTATCLQCRIKVPGVEIEREILDQRVPYCKACLEAHKTAEAQKSKTTKKKRKKRNEWEDDSDESDDLLVGVMKVAPGSLSLRFNLTSLSSTLTARHYILWGETYGRL